MKANNMPKWLPNSEIGKRIREIRKRLGLSQQALAALLGAPGSQSDVSRWETGKTRPSYETLAAIAALVGEDVSIFQEGGLATPMLALHDAYGQGEAMTPNYEGLGIDLPGYERLLERPRRMFDAFMLELIGRGLGREDLEDIGRSLLAPIAGFNTVYKDKDVSDARREESQIKILSALIAEAREIVKGDAA